MRKENFLLVAVAVLLALLFMAPVAYMAFRNLPSPVAQVDLQKLVEEEQQRSIDVLQKGNGSVSDEQRTAFEKRSIGFAKQLSESIDTLGHQCQCVIVNKAAILGGSVIDYTDAIRQRMKK
jgi:hypothetical protein